MTASKPERLLFMDYLRGFLVLLVVLDHAVQGYAYRFGRFWFFPDFERDTFFDVFHMINNGFMMMLLFFLAGLFVIPSLKRRGYVSFAKERFLRLALPFIVALPILCPLLTYPRYVFKENPLMSLSEYWVGLFTDPELMAKWQAGPLWFVYYLLVLTTLLVLLYTVAPGLIKRMGRSVQALSNRPWLALAIIVGISAVILGLSDLIWGAPWWIGYGKLFYVQGSRFLLQAFYFLLGAAIAESGLLNSSKLWDGLAHHWKALTAGTFIVGGLYIGYSLNYFEDGAYNVLVRRHFHQGGDWDTLMPVLFEGAPMVLLRTTLHAVFCALISLAMLGLFRAYLDEPKPLWASLAACSYGIYLTHEPFVVWAHYWMNGTDMPTFIKWVISGFGALIISWLLVQKILLRIPGFKRIL